MKRLELTYYDQTVATCAQCGGVCCKLMPGAYIPQDLGNDDEEILRAIECGLRQGTMSIDGWEQYLSGNGKGSDCTRIDRK